MRNVQVWVLAVLLCGCQGFALLDQPPLASFTVSPPQGSIKVGDTVTLDASGSSDPQGYELTYNWTLTRPNGSDSILSSTSGAVVTFTPDSEIDYVVRLQVSARVQSDYSNSVTIGVTAADPGTTLISIRDSLPGQSPHGRVTPLGPKKLNETNGSLDVLAEPDSGYRFVRWVADGGAPVIAESTKASTVVTVAPGQRAIIRAEFEASIPFFAWTGFGIDGSQPELVKLDTSLVQLRPLGGDLKIVALARSPGGSLFGLGDTIFAQGLSLYRINTTNGSVMGDKKELRDATGSVPLSSLAFAPDGTLWGLEASGDYRLVWVNPETGWVTAVGSSGKNLKSLAVSPQGQFYATDGVTFFTVDRKTGAVMVVGSLGTAEPLSSLTFGGDLLVARDSNKDTSLYSIDVLTGAALKFVTFENSGLLALADGS